MERIVCAFCHEAHKASKEDVLPHWLARTFPAGRDSELTTVSGPSSKFSTGGSHKGKRVGKASFALFARLPCEKCNNTWLSDLEKSVIPILTPMLKGQPSTLAASDQKLIARWAFKTSLMYEHGAFTGFGAHRWKDHQPIFGDLDHQVLYQNRPLPDGTFVFLGAFEDSLAAAALDPDYSQYSYPGVPLVNLIKHTVAVNHLVFQVCAFRWPKDFEPPRNERGFELSTPATWKDALVRIYPAAGPVSWPPAKALNFRGLQALADRQL